MGKMIIPSMPGVGGSAPSWDQNVAFITVEKAPDADDAAIIKWSDPASPDWAGSSLIRKQGSAPASPTDGVQLADSTQRDQYATSGYRDAGLTDGATYYYLVLPRNAAGAQTYNEANRRALTIAYVYPSPLAAFAVAAGDERATITFTLPADATGVRIVYKPGAYPATMTDGTVIDSATSGMTVTGLANATSYHFRAFPYNANGRYNTATGGNQAMATPQEIIPPPISGLSATAGNGQATLSWTTPGGVTRVDVVYKQGGAPASMTDGTLIAGVASPLDVTGLPNGVETSFRFATYNQYGRANDSTAGQTVAATPKAYDPVLANNTWGEIAEAAADGSASSIWQIGDVKTETLNGNTQTFEILGFDHDGLASIDARYNDPSYNGNKKNAGITFCMRDLLSDVEWAMTVGNTSVGGWDASNMRTTNMDMLKGYIPNELRGLLRTVNKPTSAGQGTAGVITISSDQLFLLSEVEITGSNGDSRAGEGNQYAYYMAGNSLKKYRNGTAYTWWLRSPRAAGSYWLYVNAEGAILNGQGNGARGVAACFCL